jgi:hypothetical protein
MIDYLERGNMGPRRRKEESGKKAKKKQTEENNRAKRNSQEAKTKYVCFVTFRKYGLVTPRMTAGGTRPFSNNETNELKSQS